MPDLTLSAGEAGPHVSDRTPRLPFLIWWSLSTPPGWLGPRAPGIERALPLSCNRVSPYGGQGGTSLQQEAFSLVLGQLVDDGSPPRARGFASTMRVPVPELTGRGPVSPRWNIRCWKGFCRWCSPPTLLHPPHLKAGAPPTFSVATQVKARGTGGAGLSVGADLSVNLPKAEADAGGR